MRYVNISKLEPGMKVYTPVYDDNLSLLINSNKSLTQWIIDKINNLGYTGLYIFEDGDEPNILYTSLVSEKLKIDTKRSLKTLNIDKILYHSYRIAEEITSSKKLCVNLIDLKTFDDYTYSHSLNVAIISTVIGKSMNCTEEELDILCASGLLHDIGKTKISKELLNKVDKLTDKEYSDIQKHVQYSYDIIKDDRNIKTRIKATILQHHENEDGTGYPRNLKSENIYKLAKIIHVADVYDALVSKRPYKKAYTYSEAIEYIMGNVGLMFDAEVVKAFIKHVVPYPIGIEVLLSDGRIGVVRKINNDILSRPEILTEDNEYIKLKDRLNLTIIKELI